MKRLILYIALSIGITSTVTLASNLFDRILEQEPQKITKLSTNDSLHQVYLKTPFAQPTIQNPGAYQNIRNRTILSVNLVYTTYAKSPSFSQRQLNRQRLKNLYQFAPELFEQSPINWKVTAQTGCERPEEGELYFHGFVITYRPEPDKEHMKKEISSLKRSIGDSDTTPYTSKRSVPFAFQTNLSCENEQPSTSYTFNSNTPYVRNKSDMKSLLQLMAQCIRANDSLREGEANVKFTVDIGGNIKDVKLQNSFIKECDSLVQKFYQDSLNLRAATEGGRRVKSHCNMRVKLMQTEDPDKKTFISTNQQSLPDSTIFKVLDRQSHWDSILLVTDVTGSMSDYTLQVLLWAKEMLRQNRVRHFVFFNDGDGKPDEQKELGQTGGIYHVRTSRFAEVKETVFKAMRNGGGGDRSENNIEAVLRGIDSCTDCRDIVMIADNYATPRDLGLLKQVKRPLHVILCGTEGGINTSYLELVRLNGGTLHTAQKDFENLPERSVGEVLQIAGKQYKIKEEEVTFLPGQ